MRTPEHVQRRKLRYKSNRTMTSLPILFALLRLILCKSITDFRVSHGKEVLNMATDDFEHVVLVIRLVERQKTVYVETCTGMKVHRKQLLGEELAKHELPDGKKAFARYVLTAAHCVTEDPEKTLKEGPLLNQELFVITLLPKIQSPKIELNGGKIKLTFDKKVAGHISKVLWVAQQGPDRDIAILKLDTELRTTVFNIQFDKTSITEEKTDCRFAGYGVDENGKDSNDIHKLIKVDPADMKLLPSNKCLSDYTTRIMNSNVKISNEAQQCALELTRIAYNSKDPELLCTRHQKGSSPCSGDSGGPLLCETVVGGKTVETVWGLFQQNGNVAIKKQPNCQGKCCNCNDKNGKTCEKELKEYVQSPSPCATQGSTRLDLHARYVNLANPATTRFLKVCVKHLQNIDRLNTKDKKEAEEFCKVKVNKKIANIAFQVNG